MCMQHIVILSSLCKWKRPTVLFFVVKRYAVRNPKIGRYAVRKGGGVSPSIMCMFCIRLVTKKR